MNSNFGVILALVVVLLMSSSCRHYSPVQRDNSLDHTMFENERPVYLLSRGPNGPRAWRAQHIQLGNNAISCKVIDIPHETAQFLWELPGQAVKRHYRKALLIHVSNDWLPSRSYEREVIDLQEVQKVMEMAPNKGMGMLKTAILTTAAVLALYFIAFEGILGGK